MADGLGQATTALRSFGLVGMAALAPSRSQKVSLQEASGWRCPLITTVVLVLRSSKAVHKRTPPILRRFGRTTPNPGTGFAV